MVIAHLWGGPADGYTIRTDLCPHDLHWRYPLDIDARFRTPGETPDTPQWWHAVYRYAGRRPDGSATYRYVRDETT